MHRRVEGTINASTRDESTCSVRRDSLLTSGEIPITTVMFCSVEFDVATTDDFDVMSNYLDGLDKLVESSDMFKYQHVSTAKKIDLVVSCPCASVLLTWISRLQSTPKSTVMK